MASMTDDASDHTITSPSAAHNGTASPSTPPSTTLPALLPTPPVPPPAPSTADPSTLPTPPSTTTTTTTTSTGTPPCQTLYIHHLNEKTPLLDLRKSLYLLFSQFGHVLHVSAARTDTTRGQAWVVMGGVESAVRAVNEMDGLMMYGRPMKVEFAKEESDVARRARGETVPKREKRKRIGTAQRKAIKLTQLNNAAVQQPPLPNSTTQPPLPLPLPLPPSSYPPLPYPLPVQMLPPNRVLFVEQLPHQLTAQQLQSLWSGQAGLVECRLVGVKPGVAFVEFSSEVEASEAMRRMQGLKVEEGHEMRVTYAKK